MRVKAAIAFEAGKPLEIADVDLDGPRDGEVGWGRCCSPQPRRGHLIAAARCHIDEAHSIV